MSETLLDSLLIAFNSLLLLLNLKHPDFQFLYFRILRTSI